MNPNLCNLCETKFKSIKKTEHIIVPATILFADIRGYTGVSQIIDSPQLAKLLGNFYEICASAIWERDGIINKLIGDAILAIFNFPITRSDHIKQAVLSGVALLKKCSELKNEKSEINLGIGIGIHYGKVSIGEIGQFCKDFTAVGETVNLASRLQSSAKSGEVLMSESVYNNVKDIFPNLELKLCNLKGLSNPVDAYSLLV